MLHEWIVGFFIVFFFNRYFKWCFDANTFYYQVHYIELYTVFLIKLNVFHVAWRVLLWVGNVLLQAATGQPQAGGQIAQIPVHKSSGNLTILLHGKKWTNLAFMIFTYTDTHACTQPHTHAHTYTLKTCLWPQYSQSQDLFCTVLNPHLVVVQLVFYVSIAYFWSRDIVNSCLILLFSAEQ